MLIVKYSNSNRAEIESKGSQCFTLSHPWDISSIAKFLISSSYFSVLRPDTRNIRVIYQLPHTVGL